MYPPAPALITAQKDWDDLVADLSREKRIAIDLESDGFHHYRERLSLVQIASPRGAWLLDPLTLKNPSAFGALLGNPGVTKLLHGSDYDLRTVDRTWGFHIRGLRDTAVATQLLYPELMGLGRAVETHLGIALPKQVRLQRSDWSRRPLPPDALEYAVHDVLHMLALDDVLSKKLAELGRSGWMAEECEMMEGIRYEPSPPPAEACFGSKGAFDLSPDSLSLFRELWLLREASAERMDRPAFKVISAEALLAIARDPGTPFDRIPNSNRRWLEAMSRDIRDAIQRARQAGPVTHPSRLKRRGNPWTPESRGRWQAVHAVRAAKAAELGIAPSTLWSTKSLEQACLDPDTAEAELAGKGSHPIRRWQRELLADALRDALAKAVSSES